MIIVANSEEGAKTKIFDKDGKDVELPIKSYNTETQEAEVYELDENGRVKMTDWVTVDRKMTRQVITKSVKLEGSYAEIDGKRV